MNSARFELLLLKLEQGCEFHQSDIIWLMCEVLWLRNALRTTLFRGASAEPSEAAIEAAQAVFRAKYQREPWLRETLRAAYAIDGVRSAPPTELPEVTATPEQVKYRNFPASMPLAFDDARSDLHKALKQFWTEFAALRSPVGGEPIPQPRMYKTIREG
jgi:hypothetical protein